MQFLFSFAGLAPYWSELLSGLCLTLVMSASATVCGFAAGIGVAAGRRSRIRTVRTIFGFYVELVRNTPFLIQIFIFYFGLSSIGVQFSATLASIIGLVINVAAYTGEIVRGGLESIPRGQIEAAECLGLSRFRVFVSVILPPAIENVYPALASQFTLMMLMTSVTSQISAEELTGAADNIQSATFLYMPTYIVVAFIYIILSLCLKFAFGAAGRLIFRHRYARAVQEAKVTIVPAEMGGGA